MKINNKEIEAVCQLDPFQRYKYFLKKVADWQVMYSLKNKEGEWALAELEDHLLFSLWPAKEYGLLCTTDSWNGFDVAEIDFDTFENEINPLISEEDLLINVFSTNSKSGFVVNLEEFLRDLNEELSQYE